MSGNLTNAQLEILKAFSTPMDDQELMEFRKWIFKFKLKKLQDHMDKVWDEKGVHPDDLLGVHMRTPYKSK
jgi:hypothetical protein